MTKKNNIDKVRVPITQVIINFVIPRHYTIWNDSSDNILTQKIPNAYQQYIVKGIYDTVYIHFQQQLTRSVSFYSDSS